MLDEAIMAWNILFKERKWCMYDDLIEFFKEEQKKSISRDAWQQLWHFIVAYPSDIKNYDPDASSWPLLFDDFVHWMKKKKKIN